MSEEFVPIGSIVCTEICLFVQNLIILVAARAISVPKVSIFFQDHHYYIIEAEVPKYLPFDPFKHA